MNTPPLVLYVLGEPGVGKTTAVRFLLRDARNREGPPVEPVYTDRPDPKWTTVRDVSAAGHYKGEPFDGADTIPYNGARVALEYWRDKIAPVARYTILDGARFATRPSLAFLRECGALIIGFHLISNGAAEARRLARATAAGTRLQNASWVKGAASGAANFAAEIGAARIDASRSALEVAGVVAELVEIARKVSP